MTNSILGFKDKSRNLAKIMLGIAIAMLCLIPGPCHLVQASSTVEFGQTKVINYFPEGLKFDVKITPINVRGSIWFNYQLGAGEWYSKPAKCQTPNSNNPADYFTCIYFVDLKELPPQLPIRYKWEFLVPGRSSFYSLETVTTYDDQRFQWDFVTKNNITIWWHDRENNFGDELVSVAEESLKKQKLLFGLENDFPLFLVIENTKNEQIAWNENSGLLFGGSTYPELGLTVHIITDTMSDKELNRTISHGISHIYFYNAVNHENNYPNWLDAGLAVYNESGTHSYERRLVETALASNQIIPLNELRKTIDDDDNSVQLAYAESFTAVEYLIKRYGEDGLKTLFKQYQEGKNTEEAFSLAFGQTLDDFENDWLLWVRNRQSNWINLFLFSYYALCSCCFLTFGLTIGGIIMMASRKKPAAQASQNN